MASEDEEEEVEEDTAQDQGATGMAPAKEM